MKKMKLFKKTKNEKALINNIKLENYTNLSFSNGLNLAQQSELYNNTGSSFKASKKKFSIIKKLIRTNHLNASKETNPVMISNINLS